VVAIGDKDEEMSAPARLTFLVRAPFRLHQHIRRVGCDAEGCPLGIGARRSEHRRIECGAASSSHRAIEPRSIRGKPAIARGPKNRNSRSPYQLIFLSIQAVNWTAPSNFAGAPCSVVSRFASQALAMAAVVSVFIPSQRHNSQYSPFA
jgi:hypothetical protein